MLTILLLSTSPVEANSVTADGTPGQFDSCRAGMRVEIVAHDIQGGATHENHFRPAEHVRRQGRDSGA